jgi:general secretion pathway protein H
MKRKRGVTLVELVVVMAIIALGAVLVVPNLGTWINYYRLRSATRDITSALRTAQMKAVSNNISYRVTFDTGANSFVLEYQASGGFKPEGPRQQLPPGVTLTDVSFSGGKAYAVFNRDSSSSSGHVTIANSKGMRRTITVSSTTGRVRVD